MRRNNGMSSQDGPTVYVKSSCITICRSYKRDLLVNCVAMFIFSDSSLRRTRQPAWSPGLVDTTTSRRFSLVYTGFQYKTAVLVWKCLHDTDPRYLAELCVPTHSVHGRQQLRSTASGTLLVPRTQVVAAGQRSFAISGSRTWNSLPGELRTPDITLSYFKRHLKAHLFQQ